jgi:hypothetical protein
VTDIGATPIEIARWEVTTMRAEDQTGRQLARNEVNGVSGPAPTGTEKQGSDAVETDRMIRLAVNLGPEAVDVLRKYANRKGVSVTEAVRRAIALLSFVDDAQRRGASINVEENGTLKEVMFL